MAAVKWYLTSTTQALPTTTADHEVLASTTAPTSGTLTGSVPKGAISDIFAGATNAAPHEHPDWNSLPTAQTKFSVDVNATHADLALNKVYGDRYDSTFTTREATDDSFGSWDSSTGTGVKLYEQSQVHILGLAADTDRYGGTVSVNNLGHMDPQDIVINLGSSTYFEFGGDKPPRISLVCGAECQIHNTGSGGAFDNHWAERVAGASSTPEVVTSPVRSGSYAFKFEAAVASPESSFLRHDMPQNDFGYSRFYFRLPSVAPTGDIAIHFLGSNSNQDGIVLYLTSGGVIKLGITTTLDTLNIATSSSTNDFSPSVDTWYGIEIEADLGTSSAFAAKWRVHDGTSWGTSETVTSVVGTASTSTLSAYFGICNNADAADANFIVYVDDITSTISWEGALYDATGSNGVSGKVLRLNPTSDGTHNYDAGADFREDGVTALGVSATDAYAWIDAADMEAAGTHLQQANVSSTEYVEVNFEDESTEDSPRGVSIVGHLNGSTTGANHRVKVSDDGTTFEDAWLQTGSLGNVEFFHQEPLELAPSGETWTRALINSTRARFGYNGSGTHDLYSLALEVEWTEELVVTRVPYFRPMKQLLPQ